MSLFLVFLLLLALSVLFSSAGHHSLFGMSLRFPSLNLILHPVQNSHDETETAVEHILSETDTSAFYLNDSTDLISQEKKEIENYHLQFALSDSERLSHFFTKLKNNIPVRILHYGDSQLEGDRITSFIRQKLQTQFGGSGAGLAMPYQLSGSLSYLVSMSDNWKRYTGFIGIDENVSHKKYGIMGAFSRFTPLQHDSIKKEIQAAWIEIGSNKNGYGNAKQFNQIKLLYGNCTDTVMLTVMQGETLLTKQLLISDGAYHSLSIETSSSVKFVFEGISSPDIYAFSLEGREGVLMDNIAMRGASGTFFNSFDQSLQSAMYQDIGADLFILQFGGNTVPYIETEERAKKYGESLKWQIVRLKKIMPDAEVIVIGPSDMSTNMNGTMETYPILTKVNDAMRTAAFEGGAAFWDMYAAMGGKNSMQVWVEKELAGDDYTHFTPEGAKYIAQLFYDALINEFQIYQGVN